MRRRRTNLQAASFLAFQDIIMCVTGIMTLCSLMLALALLSARPDAAEYRRLRRAVAAHRIEVLKLRQQLHAAAISADPEARRRLRALVRQMEAENAALEQRREELLRSALRSVRLAEEEGRKLQQEQEKLRADLRRLTARRQDLDKRIERWLNRKRLRFRVQPGFNKRAWLVQLDSKVVLVARIDRSDGLVRRFRSVGELTTWVNTTCKPSGDYFLLLVSAQGVGVFRTVRHWLLSERFTIGYDLLLSDETAVDPDWDLASGP